MSKTPSGSSYTAFRAVDDLVSKPVLGSDGSASWQEFSKNNNPRKHGPSVAPSLPMKRSAKLGTGFTTLQQERQHEEQIRSEAGEAPLGSGYTAFKRKVDPNEVAEKKRIKMAMDRVRPDNVIYFIAADSFQGWKEDYVFTTRDRGVGYYWDGNDTRNKLLNIQKNDESKEDSSPKTKKKSTHKTTHQPDTSNTPSISSHAILEGSTQPIVASYTTYAKSDEHFRNQVIQEQQMHLSTLSTGTNKAHRSAMANLDQAILTGSLSLSHTLTKARDNATSQQKRWETATDPASGKEYYFCRATGESTWDKPSSLVV